jgi:hypothetical protein
MVATSAIAGMSLTSNVVTVNTSAAHGFYPGQIVRQTSATEAPYAQGNYTVLTTPSTTQFTYALVAGNDAANANAHTFEPADLSTTNGWLADGYQVAYRYVLVTPDLNQPEVISAPSPRSIVANTSSFVGYTASTKANPIIRCVLPLNQPWPTGKAMLRVYRSKSVEVAIEPSDEMGLVAEREITATENTRGWVDVVDITPDELRGEALYTNPSQEGIEQSNNIPPRMFAGSSMVYDGSRMLYSGETKQKDQFIFSILAVGGANGIQNNDALFCVTGVTGTPSATNQFKIETGGTDAQNIRNTALNLCAAINRNRADQTAYYISAANEAPGRILIVDENNSSFYVTTNGKRGAFFPKFGPNIKLFNLSRTGTTVTATVTTGTHNFEVGDDFFLDNPTANFTEGPHKVLTVTSTTLTYTEGGTVGTASSRQGRAVNSPVSSDDQQFARVYESKAFLPEAVPPFNYADVGDTTKRVWAMAVVRNQVFAFKDDGLFIRTAPLSWELFDETVRVIAPRTVVTLLNNVYAWTTQGIVAINDTGVEIISRPIEKILSDAFNAYSVKERAFCVANELERTLHVYVPSANAEPLQAYVYNTITRTWTRQVITSQGTSLSMYSGATGVDENKNLHHSLLTTTGKLLIQRNTNTNADYQDIGGTAKTADLGVAADVAFFTLNPGFQAGDIVITNLGTTHQVSGIIDNVTDFEVYFTTTDVPLAATTFALCTAISSSWQYAPATAQNPDTLKMFRQANVLFQNAHAKSMSVEFSTELKTTPESQTINLETLAGQWTPTWDGVERPYNQSILIPQEMRRGTRLNVKVTLNSPVQAFSVNGLSIRLNPSGDKVSK